ncbi:tRNA (5-methylaminomethyl-2-thiouridine)(34)-methyltransferase MnmD [Brevundimonas goettingensis]|uniref:tRNA 5-methylaminomethyl-2-thiouridine biosynthesis bifunctional protein MnmC n=1 Tax=Brevundimonas goettingensis TaxID=2774190 RepID=A0A975GUN2_9CAUL|nr:tRNA (5-methylaminomethyl-2-thiouridine)(34)-methyltransferase MnmD [Brevundimonas goettingensis]QTC90387.1 tRNA (5-methylaminomethyl-2-thiouridine)(34)-methyltransferase MnmD [Brevundimonas goettingensis]
MLPDPETRGHADLTWSENGEPRSARFGDVYFSKDDGLAESRAVFLGGCGLPDGWAGRRQFTIAELGFGTGLNIIALLDLWRREGPADGRLNVFSIEAFPLTAEEAARALAAWPEVADMAAALIAAWPAGTPGFHRIDLPDFRATIDLAVGDAAWALEEWRGTADAWFLDGFSPALNPGMWSDAVMDGIAARSAPGARVATFTVAGAVRRGLSDRGFQVEKRPGHGRKRERLEAWRPEAVATSGPPAIATATATATVAVIGGGVAGASVARALKALDVPVVLIEAERPGAGGSGFPASLVTPRLDAGDAIIAGFHAQALERARALYSATPGAVIAPGVTQLAQSDRDAARFAKVATQPWWPEGEMTASEGGLRMAGALTASPRRILDDWLDGVATITGRVARIEHQGDTVRLLDATGAVLTEARAVIVTAGWGAADLAPALGLKPVRGQADWVEIDPAPEATAWGGYVAPTGSGFLFGATHDRDQTATEVRPGDTDRNRAVLAARLPGLEEAIAATPTQARAAIRATTGDRLPVCGALAERVWVLGGLGSRGFCVAPLLGEHLAAVVTGTPSPLPAGFAGRLSPDRLITP